MSVSGTAPIGEDGATVGDDVRTQTARCFEIALAALADVGGKVSDVLRTRVMLIDIRDWHEAAAVHGQLFAEVRPACTFVEVSGFIDPAWLVEVELDAVISDS